MLGIVLAEPVVGNAYVISALGIKNTPNNMDYFSQTGTFPKILFYCVQNITKNISEKIRDVY